MEDPEFSALKTGIPRGFCQLEISAEITGKDIEVGPLAGQRLWVVDTAAEATVGQGLGLCRAVGPPSASQTSAVRPVYPVDSLACLTRMN